MNIGPSPVDMSGVSLSNAADFAWPTTDPALRVIPPGGRMIIAGDAAAFSFRYQPGAGVTVAGVFDGNLNNAGERVTLTGPGGTIRDFSYSDDPPWPVEADGDGFSLVLNHPASNPDHNLPQNWRASSQIHGTPGAAAGPPGPTGSAAAALADSDGDGMSDLLEFATGTLGVAGAPQRWPQPGLITATVPPSTAPEQFVTFQYVRSRSADGFTSIPELSPSLSGWSPLESQFTLLDQVNHPDGTATIRWRSLLPASALPRHLFLRLRLEINP
jgi:hypothetical protein